MVGGPHHALRGRAHRGGSGHLGPVELASATRPPPRARPGLRHVSAARRRWMGSARCASARVSPIGGPASANARHPRNRAGGTARPPVPGAPNGSSHRLGAGPRIVPSHLRRAGRVPSRRSIGPKGPSSLAALPAIGAPTRRPSPARPGEIDAERRRATGARCSTGQAGDGSVGAPRSVHGALGRARAGWGDATVLSRLTVRGAACVRLLCSPRIAPRPTGSPFRGRAQANSCSVVSVAVPDPPLFGTTVSRSRSTRRRSRRRSSRWNVAPRGLKV